MSETRSRDDVYSLRDFTVEAVRSRGGISYPALVKRVEAFSSPIAAYRIIDELRDQRVLEIGAYGHVSLGPEYSSNRGERA